MPPRHPSPLRQRLQRRIWRFGSAVFDETSWTLSVDGKAIHLETKPIELLHELLQARGEIVSKEELLDRIWPGVMVVEASLPTAVRKLRVALGDDTRAEPIVVTVPRVGYRLAADIVVEEAATDPDTREPARIVTARSSWRRPAVAALAVATLAASFFLLRGEEAMPVATPTVSQAEARSALRRLDIREVERMIATGWNPNTPFDDAGSNALTLIVEQCEWSPSHDRARLVLMARTLIDGGVVLLHRNVWGDTAYSIAKADRFCGEKHPVTVMLRRLCYNGAGAPREKCEARYDLAQQGRAVALGRTP